MSSRVQHGAAYRFPEIHAPPDNVTELRRNIKDLSFFRTEHFSKPGIMIGDDDLDASGFYSMQPDDHMVFAQFGTVGFKGIYLPEPDEADAAVYTIKKIAIPGAAVLIGTRGSAKIENQGGIILSNFSVIPVPYYCVSFVCDGTDWWVIT